MADLPANASDATAPPAVAAPLAAAVPPAIAARLTPTATLTAAARPEVARAAVRVVGHEYVELLQNHLNQLHPVRAHPNRVLHLDAVVTTLLLGFYSGIITLRGLEDLSQQDDFAEQLPNERVCRSTLADNLRAFQADRLLPIVRDLFKRLPALRRQDPDLHGILRTIVALDGSVFTVPADVAWAIALTRRGGQPGRQIRLNAHVDVLQFVPLSLQVCGAEAGGEAASFIASLEGDRVYLCDRGFVDFLFMHAVLDVGSDLVVRLKSDTSFVLVRDKPLTDEDRAANILSDRIGHVPGSAGCPGFGDRLFREVIVYDAKNKKNVRLLTTLLDIPAHVIGKLYRYRWMVELFFRWLKCVASFEHLVSHDRNGITLQFYIATIAMLLTYLRTGFKPGVYEQRCLRWIVTGVGSLETNMKILERRNREREQNRRRHAAKQAAKNGK